MKEEKRKGINWDYFNNINVGDAILESLQQAIAFERGDKTMGRVTRVEITRTLVSDFAEKSE